MKSTVLVPFDGSPSAGRALEHAIARANACGLAIHILNVERPLDDYGMVPAYLPAKKHRQATAARAEALLAPALQRLKRARIEHESHVVWGDVAESIDRTARRLKCESIIMGTRGMNAVGNLLLGSIATKLIHVTKVPVTLVK